HLVFSADNNTFDVGQTFDQGHARLRSENENSGRETIGHSRAAGYDRHATAPLGRFTSRGIEDMMIPASILYKRSRVIARCAERAFRHVHLGEDPVRRAARVLNAEPPRTVALAS